MKVKFTCEGGYPGEREQAKKVLKVDKEYEAVSCNIGRSNTTVRLEGIEGDWNSCLFKESLNVLGKLPCSYDRSLTAHDAFVRSYPV